MKETFRIVVLAVLVAWSAYEIGHPDISACLENHNEWSCKQ